MTCQMSGRRLLVMSSWHGDQFLIMAYISTFFGIVIRMFYREHNPPHFHAEYQGMEAEFDFDGLMLKGNLRSHTAKQLIRQWAQLHKADLEANWSKIEQKQTLDKIEPLA